jgi:hypothetical protein
MKFNALIMAEFWDVRPCTRVEKGFKPDEAKATGL